jgi:hypothetical protein
MLRSAAIRKTLIVIHRWMGVVLCLFFFAWFASGIAMIYCDFPGVRAEDRLEHSPSLDAARIRVSPTEAHRKVDGRGRGIQMRLNTFDGRPVYRFRAGGGDTVIYADTGEVQRVVAPQLLERIAAAWTGQPIGSARSEFVTEPDQWTVAGALRTLRPLRKFSWPDGRQVYVAGTTGEVVQYTTRTSRLLAWLGPIPHWLYFTPLRKHQPLWSRFVIWISGAGTVAAAIGLAIGIWVYAPFRKLPYRGQKRWHTVLGLIFGLCATTWAFSGMLSMEPFPVPESPREINAGRTPVRAQDLAAADPRAALSALSGLSVKELELISFAGEPAWLATLAHGETRLIPIGGAPVESFAYERIVDAVRDASGGRLAEIRVIGDYDAYYRDRRRRKPLPVILAMLDDTGRTRYYIDPRTARVVASYNSRNWSERWLYHGLHSLDFPWLYRHRPLWDIVVIALLAGGCALCVTSMILAWRVVRR